MHALQILDACTPIFIWIQHLFKSHLIKFTPLSLTFPSQRFLRRLRPIHASRRPRPRRLFSPYFFPSGIRGGVHAD